jgi:tellurite methyltransferase
MVSHDDIPYDSFYRGDAPYFGIKPSDGLSEFIHQLSIAPGKTLDLGAGEGRNSLYLSEMGFDVVAIDASQSAILKLTGYARERNLKIDAKVEDFVGSEIGHEVFDLIVAVASFSSISVEKMTDLRDRIVMGLVPGGYLYAVAFTVEDPGYAQQEPRAMSECHFCVKHYFGPGELKALFSPLQIIAYAEYIKPDHTHGRPHVHGKAKLIAQKPLPSLTD